MNKIIDKTGTRKTFKLMKIAQKENAVFVCANPYTMKEKALAYGILGLEFLDYNDFHKNFCMDSSQRKYVIDELENYIYFLNSNLIGYTLTID